MVAEEEKVIVASLVDSIDGYPIYGYVQAWDVDSLQAALRQQRYRWKTDFFPVAAFVGYPEVVKTAFGLRFLPQSVWLASFAGQFRHMPIEPQFQRAIFSHYSTLSDSGAALLAVWELATQLKATSLDRWSS